MMVQAATRSAPIAARAATAASPAVAENVSKKDTGQPSTSLAHQGPTAAEVQRVRPAEGMAERAASQVDGYKPDPRDQPAFLARNYGRRRELGWLLPRPAPPDSDTPPPESRSKVDPE